MSNGAGKGLYLYCFFEGKKLPCPPVKGVDPDYDLFPLPHLQISAALSWVSLDEYSDNALCSDLRELRLMAPRFHAHKRAIEAIMASRPVIPVRFGTIFTEPGRILKVLESNYSGFISFFKYIKDKQEWGLKVYAGADWAKEAASRVGFTAKALEERSAVAPPGEAYLLKKKKELALVEEDRKAFASLSDQIYAELASRALAGRRNKLIDLNPKGERRKIILNAAFLTGKIRTEEFKKLVGEMATAYYGGGLLFQLSGPWPPYNFCPPVQYGE